MIGEEAAVGIGEAEETENAIVDGGLDGDQAGGEVGVLALPVGQRLLPVGPLLDRNLGLERLAQFGAEGGEIERPPFGQAIVERLACEHAGWFTTKTTKITKWAC